MSAPAWPDDVPRQAAAEVARPVWPWLAAMRAAWPDGWPLLPVALGAVALLAAAVLAAGLTPRWQREQAEAQARHAAASQAVMAARRPAAPAPDPLRDLVQALPPADATPQRLAALTALARRHQATVDGTRLVRVAGGSGGSGGPPAGAELLVQPVAVAMVAHGPYLALREFIAAALQQDPALALDSVRLARSGPDARELTADLQWSLLQAAAAGASR